MSKVLALDDLIALGDEIRGLVRAGIPLDRGLSAFCRDGAGRLPRMAEDLAEASQRGQSLLGALDEQPDAVPPVYRAIVAAGLRSGRLPAALESIATTARNLADTRRAVLLAMLYPIVLVITAYLLLTLVATRFLAAVLSLYDQPPPRVWDLLANYTPALTSPWVWGPPLALVLVIAGWWWRSGQALVLDAGIASRWLGVLPVVGRVVKNSRRAAMAEIMGLLVAHDVPLPEAVRLTAECTGDRRLVASAKRWCDLAEEGSLAPGDWETLDGFPPLLAWLASSGGRQQAFVSVARHVADAYRRQTRRDYQWLCEYLPMWLTIIVGGLIAAAYALLVFAPYVEMLRTLAEPIGESIRFRP